MRSPFHSVRTTQSFNTKLNQVCPLLVSPSFVLSAVDIMDVDSATVRVGTGSARRRRAPVASALAPRAALTLQMLLATYQHHAAPRGQTTARSGEWRSELNYTATIRRTPTPQGAGTEYFSLDVEDVPADGSRPDRLSAVSGPQERVLRRTVEQIVDCVPVVPLLHTSEPQIVDSVVDVLKILDHSLPGGKAGKATRVPWLFMRHAPPRSSLPEPQAVEQLVEVPIPLTVTLADGKDDRGIRWRHVWGRSGGTCWWMVGTNHTRHTTTTHNTQPTTHNQQQHTSQPTRAYFSCAQCNIVTLGSRLPIQPSAVGDRSLMWPYHITGTPGCSTPKVDNQHYLG